jgi:hypothetical protein
MHENIAEEQMKKESHERSKIHIIFGGERA